MYKQNGGHGLQALLDYIIWNTIVSINLKFVEF